MQGLGGMSVMRGEISKSRAVVLLPVMLLLGVISCSLPHVLTFAGCTFCWVAVTTWGVGKKA